MPPLVVSHRTNAGDAPEHTLAGIAAALRDGCAAVEVDVRATRDGALVLMHDETLERTTDDSRAVVAITLADLRMLRCGPPQGHPPQPIPTLAEAMDAVGGRCTIEIDLPARGIEEPVAALVHRLGAERWTWFTPSSEDEAAQMLRLCPTVDVLFDITDEPLPADELARRIGAAARLGARAINPIHTALTPQAVALAHAAGLEVACWTVDAPEDIARVLALGVDIVTTNYPRRVFAAIAAREAR